MLLRHTRSTQILLALSCLPSYYYITYCLMDVTCNNSEGQTNEIFLLQSLKEFNTTFADMCLFTSKKLW